jgi:hypothetical protein
MQIRKRKNTTIFKVTKAEIRCLEEAAEILDLIRAVEKTPYSLQDVVDAIMSDGTLDLPHVDLEEIVAGVEDLSERIDEPGLNSESYPVESEDLGELSPPKKAKGRGKVIPPAV